jgi:hypothetical protein
MSQEPLPGMPGSATEATPSSAKVHWQEHSPTYIAAFAGIAGALIGVGGGVIIAILDANNRHDEFLADRQQASYAQLISDEAELTQLERNSLSVISSHQELLPAEEYALSDGLNTLIKDVNAARIITSSDELEQSADKLAIAHSDAVRALLKGETYATSRTIDASGDLLWTIQDELTD